MYTNVGGKIKAITSIFSFIGIIICFFAGIVVALNEEEFLPFLLGIVGAFVCWLSCIVLYGFGELIDQVASINRKLGSSDAVKEPVQNNIKTEIAAAQTVTQQNTRPAAPIQRSAYAQVISQKKIDEKIGYLKLWREKGLINEEEYNQKIAELTGETGSAE